MGDEGLDPLVLPRREVALVEGPGVVAGQVLSTLEEDEVGVGSPGQQTVGDEAIGQPPPTRTIAALSAVGGLSSRGAEVGEFIEVMLRGPVPITVSDSGPLTQPRERRRGPGG